MGLFSWNTCDTNRSISCEESDRGTFKVHMITPDGRVFTEENYEGYGEFGGKDFYELLSELNGCGSEREDGIDLCFLNNGSGDNTPGVIYPKFVEDLRGDVKSLYNSLPNPTSCEFQGFFYQNEDEDDWGYDEDEKDEWDYEEEDEDEY